jgi:ankyrin repeat protein
VLIEAGAAVDAVAANPMAVMPLHSAASARNLETVRLLLDHGAPPNARQHGGWAPIHAAAQNGDRAMIELLLQHGADPKLANDEGKTPAMVAREKGHAEVAALLEE